MDPFHAANQKYLNGGCTPYYENLMRQYKNPYTPPERKSETYERALKFRQDEIQQTQKLKENYEILHKAYTDMNQIYDAGLKKNERLYNELQRMKQNSKLESDANVAISTNSSSVVRDLPVRDTGHDDTPSATEQLVEESTEPEEPTNVPDLSGSSDQHGPEG